MLARMWGNLFLVFLEFVFDFNFPTMDVNNLFNMNEVIFEAWPNDAGIELLQSYKYLNQSIK